MAANLPAEIFFLFQCDEKSTSNDSWKAARSHFDAAGKQPEDFTISSVDLKGTKLEPNSINITFMRKYTRGLSTSTRPDLLVPAAETVLTDGRTDVKKKGAFFGKKSFWFGRVQAGRIFPYFGRVFPYFRTPSGRPSAKKGTFEEKRPLHVCVVWANLPRTSCHQN